MFITPSEVAVLAFGGEDNVDMDLISQAVILAAQRRYVMPVLGRSLSAALENGEYLDVLPELLKPALAMYIKYCILPSIAAQTGALGIVKYSGLGFDPADDVAFGRLLKRVRMDADSLIDEAIDFIESTAEFFPEYDRTENIRNNISIIGGVVL